MKTIIHFWSYLARFLERKSFQTEFLDKIKTHDLCSENFCPKIVPFIM